MKEREVFLDKLRVAATCAVVLLHTVSGVADTTDMSLYPEERKVFWAMLDLVSWCVPVFLMISGYLFLNPGRQIGIGSMVTKYCRRIVLALFLFGMPYGCLELTAVEGGFCPGMLWETFLGLLCGKTWAHMWYLYLILLLYLLTPFLRRALGAVPRWAVYGVLAVLFAGCSVLPCLYMLSGKKGFALPGDGIYFFYYICGYLFAVEKREGIKKAVRRGIIPGLALLLAGGMAFSRLWGGLVPRMAYNYPFTVLLALLLFVWAAGAGHCVRPFWTRAGALCFAVYLVHPVFLNLAYKYFELTPLAVSDPLSVLYPLAEGIPIPAAVAVSVAIFFGGTAVLSVLAAWILYRIRPLRRYVL